MAAVGHEVLARNKNKRVLFLTSEEFTNEMINAVRFDKITNFHTRYRGLMSCSWTTFNSFRQGRDPGGVFVHGYESA